MRSHPPSVPAVLRKRKAKDDYYSGPKGTRKRRPQAPPPVETLEQKIGRNATALWEWASENSRECLAIAAGLALVITAVVWYFVKEAEQESQAWARLSLVSKDVMLSARAGAPQPGAQGADKDEGVERKFRRISRDLGTTSATPFVELALANTLYEKSDYQGAHDACARLVREHAASPAGKLGLLCRAAAAEQLGKYDDAIEALTAVRQDCPEYLRAQVVLDLGRCMEAAHRTADARQQYQRVLDLTTDESLRAVAKSRIERIEQERLTPPRAATPAAKPAGKPDRQAAKGPAQAPDAAAASPTSAPGK